MRLAPDRVAVVTGAAGGIGRGIARALAARGCRLALVDRDAARLSEAETEFQASGVRVSAHVVDVADREAFAALPEAVLQAHGAVHLPVNNAGVSLAGPLETVRFADCDWIVGVTCVYPGPVATEIVRQGRAWDPEKAALEARFLEKRGVPMERVAAAVLRGVERNASRVRIGRETRAIDALARLSPAPAAALVGRLRKRVPFL